jgi:predicted 3-demethylubiquinone-9 3-methyltransferase (glyoxalase superfamily)
VIYARLCGPINPQSRLGRNAKSVGTLTRWEKGRRNVMQTKIQRITPFLWFDSQAEEAARFYTQIFKDSKIMSLSRYGEAGAEASGRPKGTVMTVAFQLEGQESVALNGGPYFKFTEAISFVVNCESQEEVDYY